MCDDENVAMWWLSKTCTKVNQGLDWDRLDASSIAKVLFQANLVFHPGELS